MSDWFTQNLSTPSGAAATQPPPGPPAQPPTTQNWFLKNLNGQPASPPASQPAAPVNTEGIGSVTDNPRGEGIYRMVGPDGKQVGIPYSKAKALGKPQGYSFVDDAEANRFMKDYIADPELNASLTNLARNDAGLSMFIGFAKHALRLAYGTADATSGGKTLQGMEFKPTPEATGTGKALRDLSQEEDQNFGERAGGLGEELLSFESLSKLFPELTGTQKMQSVTKLAQLAEKHPVLAQALRQGATAGTQTYLSSGGDPAQAAEAAAGTTLVGGAIGGVSAKMGGGVRNAMPGTETVGGQEFETPPPKDVPKPTKNQAAGQATIRQTAKDVGRAHLEELNESRASQPERPALPARTGPFQFNLKGVSPSPEAEGPLTSRAQKIPRSHTSIPAERAGSTEYSRVGTEPEYIRPGDTFAQRTGRVWAERRIPGYQNTAPGTAGRADVTREFGTMTTEDPNVARAHLDNLDQAINGPGFGDLPPQRQAELLDAHEDAQRQLADYHQQVRTQLPGYGKPQMLPVDVPTAIDKIGSFSDTAATLKATATHGYDHITDALGLAGESPQRLTQIRQAYQAAEAKFMAAESPEALQAAEHEIEAAHGQLRAMVGRIPNAISLSELSGLNTAYANSLGLEKFSRAVDGAFTGTPTNRAARAGEYYGFNGQKLGENIRSFVRTVGRGRAERLIGADRLDTLLRVADLNTSNAGRAKFGAAVNEVGDNLIRMHVGPIAAGGYIGRIMKLPWELGAAAGWATAEGTRKLTGLIVSRPQLAKNLLFALDSGAKPEHYGPFIATMIRKMVEQSNKEEPENANQTR